MDTDALTTDELLVIADALRTARSELADRVERDLSTPQAVADMDELIEKVERLIG